MSDQLVSVIITTYGRSGDLIFESINSVRSQTYKNIEIIVVDDNGYGTENQRNNEKLFLKEKDIRYIANQKNSGAQVSRNAGILASKGAYIACLDDDDIWVPEKIEKQVALMEEEALGLVFCNGYRFYNNDLNDKKPYQFNFISDRILDFNTELRSDHIGSTSIPLMRKECLAQTGLFDVDMPARQDYEMWLRFCRYFKEAARLAGVRVVKVEMITYIVAASLAGLSGALISARVTGAYLGMGDNYQMESIACIVIGGTLMSGGRANTVGTLVGCVFLYLIVSCMQLMGADAGMQSVVKGALIIIVLLIGASDNNKKREKKYHKAGTESAA